MNETKTAKPITSDTPRLVGQRLGCDEWLLPVIEERAIGKVVRNVLFIVLPQGTIGIYNETPL